ncbi:MAG TPA: deoxyribonuclease V [Candidatus Brocadiia bacterium]|nr:deoxyribonuclease V [Candidatus Brocadiia bacterium]
MEVHDLHAWELTPAEAIKLQNRLRKLTLEKSFCKPEDWSLVAGCDVSYARHDDRFFAGVIVLRLSDFQVVDSATAVVKSPFPYVPGLLSFREAPALLDAFKALKTKPDVVIADGQGLAHPRRFGLACHLGLFLDMPVLGCAKSRLIGEYVEPGPRKGERTALIQEGERIGTVLRTRDRVKPVFVSVGHMTSLQTSEDVVMRCLRGYRLPEPTRQAHILVNKRRASG